VRIEKSRHGHHLSGWDDRLGDKRGWDIPYRTNRFSIDSDINVWEEAVLVVEGDGGDILDQGTHCFTSKNLMRRRGARGETTDKLKKWARKNRKAPIKSSGENSDLFNKNPIFLFFKALSVYAFRFFSALSAFFWLCGSTLMDSLLYIHIKDFV
jgi:hypothetical protein